MRGLGSRRSAAMVHFAKLNAPYGAGCPAPGTNRAAAKSTIGDANRVETLRLRHPTAPSAQMERSKRRVRIARVVNKNRTKANFWIYFYLEMLYSLTRD